MTTLGRTLESVAEKLWQAERTRTPTEPVRDDVSDLGAAYQVQRLVQDHWSSEGRRRVGYKIGATSRVVRQEFGLVEPDAGVLWADTVYADGDEVPLSRFLMPRIETEIAFVLEREILVERPTVVDLMRATAYVLPAMELADCRIHGWDTTAIDSVCDNGSGGGAVLGCVPVRPSDLDLRALTAIMEVDGEAVAVGSGSACMGNPWIALAWLAEFLFRSQTALQAGDIILTGALLRVQPCGLTLSSGRRSAGWEPLRSSLRDKHGTGWTASKLPRRNCCRTSPC